MPALAFAVLAPLWLRGTFGGDFERSLPNGYRISGDSTLTSIYAPQQSVYGPPPASTQIGGQIDRVAVVGALVTGRNTYAMSPDPQGPSPVGYFILDTVSNTAEVGLSEAAWQASLAAHGISTPPTLKSPRWLW